MAKKSTKDELIEACKAARTPGDLETISAGRTIWLQGKPAPADKGMIALDTAAGTRVLVREQDVKTVESGDAGYLVEITEDAETIVRFEAIAKATNSSCGCGEHGSSQTPGAAERRIGNFYLIRDCKPVVKYSICRWVTDRRGVGRVICIPVVTMECKEYPVNLDGV